MSFSNYTKKSHSRTAKSNTLAGIFIFILTSHYLSEPEKSTGPSGCEAFLPLIYLF
ncbi:MAG TPA: hypothetical protein VEW92_01805 [Nitrososphaeraceae archaeon]|nr:hypothetical protein [Nitrososphaeraceae archaeon]